jgi:Bardet-Biedl syndrome 9 protein
MCTGAFGNVTAQRFVCVQVRHSCMTQINVQSLDGALSFFERDTFTFTRFLPGSLLPGPLVYAPLIDSFVTVASAWQVECYKYQTLAMASEASSRVEAASGKRVTVGVQCVINPIFVSQPDWTYELGENALSINVLEISPAQPSIIVLGERNCVCVTEGGTVRFIVKMDYHPIALLAYTSSAYARTCVCNAVCCSE